MVQQTLSPGVQHTEEADLCAQMLRIGGDGNGTENLPATTFRFDIANPDLEMPLAVLTAPNECRIQGHSDRRYRHVRPRSGLIPQHRADFQSVMAQGLGVISGVNRKHLL